MTQPQHADLAKAIRFLAADAVERAKSGHPGMVLGMADVATVLFSKYLRFNATQPRWNGRDRFVLSAGHGSMLLYALGYLLGYAPLTREQLQNFRQLHSRTPGHPEYDVDCGIETTTGPLGQGIGNAVGMALAAKMQNQTHKIYCVVGDGCLMEGISHEAASFAGHNGLNNLIVLFDDNNITIDGKGTLSYSDDTLKRFESYGFAVSRINGHDPAEIESALTAAQNSTKPVFIACKTTIGYGAPALAGSHKTHGSPLGEAEVAAMRAAQNWPHAPFDIPENILNAWRALGTRTPATTTPPAPTVTTAALAALEQLQQKFLAERPAQATRVSSQACINAIAPALTQFVGGSADLAGSTGAQHPNAAQHIHFGVREHAMAAICNGLALGGLRPYCATFLTFSDYMKNSMRLSALMGLPVTYILTHDSIGQGEDGPTHQPVEHLAGLRAIPGMLVLRPADAAEVAAAWAQALQHTTGPTCLILSRQNVASVCTQPPALSKGAYIISAATSTPKLSLIATGAEVGMAIEAQKLLAAQNVHINIVSMPSMELFEAQSPEYKASILPANIPVAALEAACRFGWDKYVGANGLFFGVNTFGHSAPGPKVFEHFGLTAPAIAAKISAHLS